MTGTDLRTKGRMTDYSAAQAPGAHYAVSIKLLKILILLLGVLLAWGLVSWLISCIPLTKLEVTGLNRYSEHEVLATSGLAGADKLTAVNAEEVKSSLIAAYPYIKSVRLRYTFPLGYRLEITEEVPTYYTYIAGDYFTLSEDLRVLERATSPRRFAEEGLLQLSLGGIRSAMLGETLDYGGSYLDAVLTAVEESVVADRVTGIQLADRYHLNVICDEIYTVKLGDITSIDAKLRLASLMMQEANVPQGYRATLDVSDLKKTSIRYDGMQDGALSASE